MKRRGALLALAGSLMLLAAPESPGPVEYTASLANVAGAPDAIHIEVLRWSTDEERARLLAAWSLRPPAGRGVGKGAAKSGKGAAKAPAPEVAAAPSPEVELGRALQESVTVGYLWSSELSGYALRFAGRVTSADGSQRVILMTQRQLGAMSQKWNLAEGTVDRSDFSLIELHLNAAGQGEGKASLTGNLVLDTAAQSVALAGYESLPVILRDVRTKGK
jgi:hypothetical protein